MKTVVRGFSIVVGEGEELALWLDAYGNGELSLIKGGALCEPLAPSAPLPETLWTVSVRWESSAQCFEVLNSSLLEKSGLCAKWEVLRMDAAREWKLSAPST